MAAYHLLHAVGADLGGRDVELGGQDHLVAEPGLASRGSGAVLGPVVAPSSPVERVVMPIRDAMAHATFYLLCSQAAGREARDVLTWVSGQVGAGGVIRPVS